MNELKLRIDNQELDIDANSGLPITFDYKLEDSQDFQKKKSSESLDLTIPATLNNQKVLNTFHNTSIEDYTRNKNYRNIRNITVEAGGLEIFVGKAIPKKATKRNGLPLSYSLNCFGNNADWIIDLKELTFYDLLKHIEFVFDKKTIEQSWSFDGTNEKSPYVFAPVKYGGWLDPEYDNGENKGKGSDKNYSIKTMRPSLSVYWLLYFGFKSIGYKIKSCFFETSYFRRLVIPWTFGSFLTSEGTKYEIHKFLAKTNGGEKWFKNSSGKRFENYIDLDVRDNVDSGCFDANNTIEGGDYRGIDATGGGTEMIWKYNTPHYGPLEVMMKLSLSYDYKLDFSSDMRIQAHWIHIRDGKILEQKIDNIRDDEAPSFGATQGASLDSIYRQFTVNPNDEIICKIWLRLFRSKTATVCRCKVRVDEFTTDSFKVPVGGNISFDSYLTLQKEKFNDFLRGIADLFNLSFQTDPVNKVVLIEPTHKYTINRNMLDLKEGFFTDNTLNWTEKEDISKESYIEIFDDNAREFIFKFKDDTGDGALKTVQDRYKITLASGKYVFNERFKADKKEFENRYFSPTMHYLVDDFTGITNQPPQMVCLVPENISNTSSLEAQNTFLPKICFYKGMVSGVGGWRFDGKDLTEYPYMFSVNYKKGGENDPVLSYSDEKIGDQNGYTSGIGLLKRFFTQRLVIMNNGQWLTTQFNLTNIDITNWFHRERIVIHDELWELLEIKGYNPLNEDSTKCILRKWYPITKEDYQNIYPSQSSILKDIVITNNDKTLDSQYNRLLCLYTDIPKPK